jgi:hypothetical protein
MEEVTNLLEFAIEDSTLSYDLDDRPIIDKNKLVDMLNEIINRRENALKHRIKKEAQEAIKKVLQEV